MERTSLTRRRALGAAAWSAPVIVAASAAPAMAISLGGSPAVRVTSINATRPSATAVDAAITFTNAGNVDSTSLTGFFRIRTQGGSFTNSVSTSSAGWTINEEGFAGTTAGWEYSYARAGGLAVDETVTLAIRYPASGNGTIVFDSPVTDPAGTNIGLAGVYTL